MPDRSSRFFGVGLALLAACGPAPAQGRRAAADIGCVPAGESLAYDCLIKIRDARSGEPLSGLAVTLGADMPSMPMAHNVRPVAAKPAGEPGTYKARLELEMFGDWAVRVDIGGPMRDRIVEVLRFEKKSVSAPPSRSPAAGHKH